MAIYTVISLVILHDVGLSVCRSGNPVVSSEESDLVDHSSKSFEDLILPFLDVGPTEDQQKMLQVIPRVVSFENRIKKRKNNDLSPLTKKKRKEKPQPVAFILTANLPKRMKKKARKQQKNRDTKVAHAHKDSHHNDHDSYEIHHKTFIDLIADDNSSSMEDTDKSDDVLTSKHVTVETETETVEEPDEAELRTIDFLKDTIKNGVALEDITSNTEVAKESTNEVTSETNNEMTVEVPNDVTSAVTSEVTNEATNAVTSEVTEEVTKESAEESKDFNAIEYLEEIMRVHDSGHDYEIHSPVDDDQDGGVTVENEYINSRDPEYLTVDDEATSQAVSDESYDVIVELNNSDTVDNVSDVAEEDLKSDSHDTDQERDSKKVVDGKEFERYADLEDVSISDELIKYIATKYVAEVNRRIQNKLKNLNNSTDTQKSFHLSFLFN